MAEEELNQAPAGEAGSGAPASSATPASAPDRTPQPAPAPERSGPPAKGYRAREAFSVRLGWHGTYRFEKGHEFDARQGKELYDQGCPVQPIR